MDVDAYHRLLAAQMTEAALLAQVRALAQHWGWWTYHTHDSRRSEAGFPDLVLVRERRLLYRELKTEKGRLSPAQRSWLDRLAGAGADVGVWRPRDQFDGTIDRLLRAGHPSGGGVASPPTPIGGTAPDGDPLDTRRLSR